MSVMRTLHRRIPSRFALALMAIGCAAALYSQEPPKQVLVDEKTLQTLLTRVDQLEARVKQLEAERNLAGSSARLPLPPLRHSRPLLLS